jgi:hypothetical protein
VLPFLIYDTCKIPSYHIFFKIACVTLFLQSQYFNLEILRMIAKRLRQYRL